MHFLLLPPNHFHYPWSTQLFLRLNCSLLLYQLWLKLKTKNTKRCLLKKRSNNDVIISNRINRKCLIQSSIEKEKSFLWTDALTTQYKTQASLLQNMTLSMKLHVTFKESLI